MVGRSFGTWRSRGVNRNAIDDDDDDSSTLAITYRE
jgi:hypothetical protein